MQNTHNHFNEEIYHRPKGGSSFPRRIGIAAVIVAIIIIIAHPYIMDVIDSLL